MSISGGFVQCGKAVWPQRSGSVYQGHQMGVSSSVIDDGDLVDRVQSDLDETSPYG